MSSSSSVSWCERSSSDCPLLLGRLWAILHCCCCRLECFQKEFHVIVRELKKKIQSLVVFAVWVSFVSFFCLFSRWQANPPSIFIRTDRPVLQLNQLLVHSLMRWNVLVPELTESGILTLHVDKPINFHQQPPVCVHVLSFLAQNNQSFTFDGASLNHLKSPKASFCLVPKTSPAQILCECQRFIGVSPSCSSYNLNQQWLTLQFPSGLDREAKRVWVEDGFAAFSQTQRRPSAATSPHVVPPQFHLLRLDCSPNRQSEAACLSFPLCSLPSADVFSWSDRLLPNWSDRCKSFPPFC